MICSWRSSFLVIGSFCGWTDYMCSSIALFGSSHNAVFSALRMHIHVLTGYGIMLRCLYYVVTASMFSLSLVFGV